MNHLSSVSSPTSSLGFTCFFPRHQEGKSIRSSSGFSGKGFKFDETEHALANERKKLQKAALGLQDSDDEDGALDVSSGDAASTSPPRWLGSHVWVGVSID